MFCSKCGKQVFDDAMFCNSCGTPTTAAQPQCAPPPAQQYAPPPTPQYIIPQYGGYYANASTSKGRILSLTTTVLGGIMIILMFTNFFTINFHISGLGISDYNVNLFSSFGLAAEITKTGYRASILSENIAAAIDGIAIIIFVICLFILIDILISIFTFSFICRNTQHLAQNIITGLTSEQRRCLLSALS